MKIKLLLICFLLSLAAMSYAQGYAVDTVKIPEAKRIVFRFMGEDDMFYIPWQGNGAKLDKLLATINLNKKAIQEGMVKIHVVGYSSAYSTATENLKSAARRANRVKSEMILRSGITETSFRTKLLSSAYDGWKSVVLVCISVPELEPHIQESVSALKVEMEWEPRPEVKSVPEPAEVADPLYVPFEQETELRYGGTIPKASYFAIRTNLLYAAFLLPTLGVEWRISERWGLKADWSGSYWTQKTGAIQKNWVLSPALRYYLDDDYQWYAAVAGNLGEFNNYKGLLGSVLGKDTGYQGSLWNLGVAGGYQFSLNRRLKLDLNLGIGYGQYKYDSFEIIDQVRVFKAKKQTKIFWGPTQAGLNLVWTVLGNK